LLKKTGIPTIRKPKTSSTDSRRSPTTIDPTAPSTGSHPGRPTTPPSQTPATAPLSAHYRVRIDTVDRHGKITLRHAGILHHLGIGRQYSGTPALILIDEYEATVTHRTTGEVLGAYLINPTTNYWPKQKKSPTTGRALPEYQRRTDTSTDDVSTHRQWVIRRIQKA
jgi:hypothetical protein